MTGPDLAESFERCIRGGGVALFPADTVYGLACDPESEAAISRLYELKRRPPAKAAAVMYFDLDAALAALPELGARTRLALGRLMPGGVTALLPNPARRFPLACGSDPQTLGLRVVSVRALDGVEVAVMQSSANLSGGPEARRVDDVAPELRAGVDLIVDGGELPGTPSTVIDMREYEDGVGARWDVVRRGAVTEDELRAALDGQYHFDPNTYADMIRDDIPIYDALQDALVAASGDRARTILELGTGTGETARRLLLRHPDASLVAVDESGPMLEQARVALPPARVEFVVARLQDRLPGGPFDVVASALCVHHLDGEEKADLFRRMRAALSPGGRFVVADVVEPEDPADARIPLTSGYDKPSTVADQLRWLREAGFAGTSVVWQRGELAVILAQAPA